MILNLLVIIKRILGEKKLINHLIDFIKKMNQSDLMNNILNL